MRHLFIEDDNMILSGKCLYSQLMPYMIKAWLHDANSYYWLYVKGLIWEV